MDKTNDTKLTDEPVHVNEYRDNITTVYLSSEIYKKKLLELYGNTSISILEVIEGIIIGFGKDGRSLLEEELDKILSIILGDGKNIAIACDTDPVFSKLKFEYRTSDGEGIISIK